MRVPQLKRTTKVNKNLQNQTQMRAESHQN